MQIKGGESAKVSMEMIVPLWLSNITKILLDRWEGSQKHNSYNIKYVYS